MSRIGKQPIDIPDGVKVDIKENIVTVKGPKGTLTQEMTGGITAELDGKELKIIRPSDESTYRSLHGLYRSLIANMIVGVTEGYEKSLEIVGVGYRAELSGKNLILRLGFSHPVKFDAPEGITFEVPSETQITIKGADKCLVGQIAANIRKLRKPEPYKGKGVRYKGEHVRRKAGKIGA
jgi:large subunit ribosomal protein L6